ncbi:LacI family DNA-binding transcriptional regulator [Raineyella fluvialis]|uniref:Substrate-binding domain-containing protein n=1 Tax=Raineyella fluvialis TaxID=2662261 RepID=A0A5Q2F9H1_9ACTN|nr:LacI family DNA-binding transcriptional regulator [Raineyella fluvialis]QGF23031.1 substrate-binding domain-containing protein [Raineyella fluvialis]
MTSPSAGRPSVKDVAERAGVSVGTVSHVLNHPDRVSDATLQRVRTAIDDLGFIPSGAARHLRQGTSQAVGLVVADIANPYYIEAARAVEDSLVQRGMAMMMSSTDGDPERERRILEMLAAQQVRGIILTPSERSPENLALVRRRGIPTVLLDGGSSRSAFSTVGVDDVAGGRMAVAHLLASGHRSIAVISGPLEVRQAADRWEGARQAVRDAGLNPRTTLVHLVADSFSAEAGAEAMSLLLEGPVRPTAAFTVNDVMAIGAMRTLRREGLRIPEEMALVGYDDIPVAAELITPLTTVRQPMASLGRRAAELLLEGRGVEHVLFRPHLAVRASAP